MLVATCCLFFLIFGGIAFWAFKKQSPMPFYTAKYSDQPKLKENVNVKTYNRAIGALWLSCAIGFLLPGLVSLFNTALGFVILMVVGILGSITIIIGYFIIYAKFLYE